VSFTLPENSDVSLQVTSMDGRIVQQFSPQTLAAGQQNLILETKTLAAGLYLIQLRMGNSVVTSRLVIAR